MRRTFLRSEMGVGFFELAVLVLLFAFGALVFYGYCQEERITLTTYYPSPFAVYRDLNVTRTLNMTQATAAAPSNGIYFAGPAGGAMIRGWANQLRLEVASNPANTIFIGSQAGTGMVIENDGDAYFSGTELLTHSPGVGQGCVKFSYGSSSGAMNCPAGFTLDLNLSGAPSATGGIFYCCK